MFKRHIVENIFNLIAHFLDALNNARMIWHAKLVSVSTNGENTMTRCHHGILTRLEQAAKFLVLHIWCVPHQIDIVIRNVVAFPQDAKWIEVLYKWCMHLCHQEKLIIDMNGDICPKKTNRWVHLDDTLSSVSHVDARSSSTWMPVRISSHHQPSGGQSCSLLHQRSARSIRLSSSCKTDCSSSSSKRSRSGSPRTC